MRLIGVNAQNARKLVITVIFIATVWLLSWGLRSAARFLVRNRTGKRLEFWTRQAIQIATTLLIIVGLLSIWFSDPSRLATFLGLISAGLAFAMQRVVTAICGTSSYCAEKPSTSANVSRWAASAATSWAHCHHYERQNIRGAGLQLLISAFDSNGLEIASGTYEIVGMPDLNIHVDAPPANGAARKPERVKQSRQ